MSLNSPHIFKLFFPAFLKTIENLKFWPSECINQIHFPTEEDTMKKIEGVLPSQMEMTDTKK